MRFAGALDSKHVFRENSMYIALTAFPQAPGAINGRPDPSNRHPGGVWGGLKTWLFEGPKYIGSLWVLKINDERMECLTCILRHQAEVPKNVLFVALKIKSSWGWESGG